MAADGPEVRTVTLRGADRSAWTVAFHADARAGLVAQLLADPRIGLHFYDADEHTQLRLRGRASVHAGDALARERWGRASGPAHRCYFVPPPGTPATGPTSGLPPALAHRAPTASESAAVFDRFAVVVVAVAELEWFQVHSVERRRARFRPADGGWGVQWLTP
jgi:3-hydroxyisobutyrate dehydrogenase